MLPIIYKSRSVNDSEIFLKGFIESQSFDIAYLSKIVPETSRISIDQIRRLRKQANLSSGKIRTIVFESFDSATTEAQNALLKMLEERNKEIQFILFVENIEVVLRCLSKSITAKKCM